MRNIKKELLGHIEDQQVSYIKLRFEEYYDEDCVNIEGTLEEVLADTRVNVKYDEGFGTQHLFGYIWYTDGTWSQREEYDGSEWWIHVRRPDPSDELM